MHQYNETLQKKRAESIKKLLENNPQLDDTTKSMWKNKLNSLAIDENEYNQRVKEIYKDFDTRIFKDV